MIISVKKWALTVALDLMLQIREPVMALRPFSRPIFVGLILVSVFYYKTSQDHNSRDITVLNYCLKHSVL